MKTFIYGCLCLVSFSCDMKSYKSVENIRNEAEKKIKKFKLISAQIKPYSADDRGKFFIFSLDKKLVDGRYNYNILFQTKDGREFTSSGILSTPPHSSSSRGPDFRINLFLDCTRHDPPEKREYVKNDLVNENLQKIIFKLTFNGGKMITRELSSLPFKK